MCCEEGPPLYPEVRPRSTAEGRLTAAGVTARRRRARSPPRSWASPR
jgi:hypothetical protein